jgi:thiazole synthase
MLTDYIDPKKITYLPDAAGCFTAEDAIRTLRLAREAGGWDLVKLEVLGEARTLYPNMIETIRATEVLAKEGFLPMVYCVERSHRREAAGRRGRCGRHAAGRCRSAQGSASRTA